MHSKSITYALSLASLGLLPACGGDADDPDTAASIELTPNTTNPEIIASWSSCSGNASGSNTSTGTSGGGSNVVRGDYSLTRYTFNSDGSANSSIEDYAESTCTNTNLVSYFASADFAYVIGDATLDQNGQPATEVNFNYNGNITYTMFIVIGNDLYIADPENSDITNDGSSSEKRLNGFSNVPLE